MNSKTAKLLAKVAAVTGGQKRGRRDYARLKAQWNGTPRPARGDLRRRLRGVLRQARQTEGQ